MKSRLYFHEKSNQETFNNYKAFTQTFSCNCTSEHVDMFKFCLSGSFYNFFSRNTKCQLRYTLKQALYFCMTVTVDSKPPVDYTAKSLGVNS